MTGPINPIVVVRNNLPDYATDLRGEKQRLLDRVAIIDEDLRTIGRLLIALEPTPYETAPGDTDPRDDPRWVG